MLSTTLEAVGLAVITAGTTAGTCVLAGLGAALLVAGVVGGAALLFLGYALSAPEPQQVAAPVVRMPTNERLARQNLESA